MMQYFDFLTLKVIKMFFFQLATHWSAYSSPVTKGEIEAHDLRSLWRNIEPHLRKALETVYLREITSKQYEEMERLAEQSGHTLPSAQTISAAAAKVRNETVCYTNNSVLFKQM